MDIVSRKSAIIFYHRLQDEKGMRNNMFKDHDLRVVWRYILVNMKIVTIIYL